MKKCISVLLALLLVFTPVSAFALDDAGPCAPTGPVPSTPLSGDYEHTVVEYAGTEFKKPTLTVEDLVKEGAGDPGDWVDSGTDSMLNQYKNASKLKLLVIKEGGQYYYYDALDLDVDGQSFKVYIGNLGETKGIFTGMEFNLGTVKNITTGDMKLFSGGEDVSTFVDVDGTTPMGKFPVLMSDISTFHYDVGYISNFTSTVIYQGKVDSPRYLILGPASKEASTAYNLEITQYNMDKDFSITHGSTITVGQFMSDFDTSIFPIPIKLWYEDKSDASQSMEVFLHEKFVAMKDKGGFFVFDGGPARFIEWSQGDNLYKIDESKIKQQTLYPAFVKADGTTKLNGYDGEEYVINTSENSSDSSLAFPAPLARYISQKLANNEPVDMYLEPKTINVKFHFYEYVLYDESTGDYVFGQELTPSESEVDAMATLRSDFMSDYRVSLKASAGGDLDSLKNKKISYNGKEYTYIWNSKYDLPEIGIAFATKDTTNQDTRWYGILTKAGNANVDEMLRMEKTNQMNDSTSYYALHTVGEQDGPVLADGMEVILVPVLKVVPPTPPPVTPVEEDEWLTVHTPEKVTVDGPKKDFNGAVEVRVTEKGNGKTDITFHDKDGNEVKTCGPVRVSIPAPEGTKGPYRILVDGVYTTFEEVEGNLVFIIPATDGTTGKDLTAVLNDQTYVATGTDYDFGEAVRLKVWEENGKMTLKLLNAAGKEVHSKGFIFVTVPAPKGSQPPYRVLVDGVYTTFESPTEGTLRFGAKF